MTHKRVVTAERESKRALVRCLEDSLGEVFASFGAVRSE
jgi:hypothetical protein